nr:WD40 repeat domain-containing protein [Bacteroidota bacterium]
MIYFFILICSHCCGQNRNNIWCFGDSAGIDFSNINNPIPIHSAIKSRGSCVSIADTNSQVLFSAYTRAGIWGKTTLVKNKQNKLMLNGSNIGGEGWYWELIIIPQPDSSEIYYLFSTGVAGSSPFGLYYSIIDMSLDSSRGAVTQKNIQLLPYAANDGLTAVKHGNGRDWWVLFRKNGLFAGWYDNRFYTYLISPQGVNFVDSQAIGSLDYTNTLRYVFNKDGNKLAMVSLEGIVETFDFDRCTGLLSNHQLIRAKNTAQPWPALWSCAFSPNSQYLYVSTNESDSKLIQIDLQSPQPWLNCDTIYIDTNIIYAGGALKLAPDNKIYYSCAWYDGFNFSYPYPDSTFNIYNNNLSVINSPDSPGLACNFSPYSFNLGGGRTYWGLPNNPDYDLGPIKGSPCDTLSANLTPPLSKGEGVMQITYISAWEKLFINASGLKGKHVTVSIYDAKGSLKVQEFKSSKVNAGYFTLDVDCGGWANGLYVVHLKTEVEMLSRKFVRE